MGAFCFHAGSSLTPGLQAVLKSDPDNVCKSGECEKVLCTFPQVSIFLVTDLIGNVFRHCVKFQLGQFVFHVFNYSNLRSSNYA